MRMKLASCFRLAFILIYACVPLLMGASNLTGGGCGNLEDDNSPTDIVLNSIEVSPADQSILINSTEQFSATGTYSDGSTADITALATWTTSDSSLVSIDENGLASSGASDTSSPVSILATLDSITGSTTLSVVDLSPAITGISPTTGSASGGGTVIITGLNFTNVSNVLFGSTPATSFTVDSSTQITAVSPTGAASTINITIVTSNGTSNPNPSDEFTFVEGPVITSVSPNVGLTAGGYQIAISGSGFLNLDQLYFGAVLCSAAVVAVDGSSILATVPAQAAGTVNITAITPYGTSPISSSDEFTYGDAPTLSSVSPNAGPTAGGTSVTITGTDFSGASAVSFGSNSAISFTVDSNNQITATSPAGTGTVDITVTTAFGTSTTSSADQFTYAAAPTVTGLAPSSGTPSGGTSVIITGTNFTGASAVNFGATSASFTVDSATQITATSPAGTGTVDVTVTTPGGSSATSSADEFTYSLPMILFASTASSGNLGGRSGADALCTSSLPVGLSCTNLHALISVSASDEIQDMPTNYSVPLDRAIASEGGTTIQTNWANLLSGSILSSLVNAGILTMSDTYWWSGSNDDGTFQATYNCTNWTVNTNMVSGYSGYYNQTGTGWISAGVPTCNGNFPILCLCY